MDGKIGLALAPALAPPPRIPIQTASSDDYSPPKSLNPFLIPEQVPVPTSCEFLFFLLFWKIYQITMKFSFQQTNLICLLRGNQQHHVETLKIRP